MRITRTPSARLIDRSRERKDLPSHVDLGAVKVVLDKKRGDLSIGHQLMGLLPEDGEAVEYWTLIDADGPGKGATAKALAELKAPQTRFRGADFHGQSR